MEVVEINDTGTIKQVIPHTAIMELVHNDEACVQNGVSYHCVDIPIGERMHYAVRCVMSDKKGRRVESIGESLAATLDSIIAKNYPYLMANKRAIDSAAISFLGFDSKVYSDAQIAVMPALVPASSLINDAAAGSDAEQANKQGNDISAPQTGAKAGSEGKKQDAADTAKPIRDTKGNSAKQGEKDQTPASAATKAKERAIPQEKEQGTSESANQPAGTRDTSVKPEQTDNKPVSSAGSEAETTNPAMETKSDSSESEQAGEKVDLAVSTAGEGQGDAPWHSDEIPEVQVISSETQPDNTQPTAVDLTGALTSAEETGADPKDTAGTAPRSSQSSAPEGESPADAGGAKGTEAIPDKPSPASSTDSTPNTKAESSGVTVNTDLGEFKDPSDPYSLIVKYGKRKGYNWTIRDLAEKDIESLKWLASFTARTPKAEETKRIAASWLSEYGENAGNEGKNAA